MYHTLCLFFATSELYPNKHFPVCNKEPLHYTVKTIAVMSFDIRFHLHQDWLRHGGDIWKLMSRPGNGAAGNSEEKDNRGPVGWLAFECHIAQQLNK